MVAVINTVVSLFYYLRVIAPAVVSSAEVDTPSPARLSKALAAGLPVATVATVGLGVIAEPPVDLAHGTALMPGTRPHGRRGALLSRSSESRS